MARTTCKDFIEQAFNGRLEQLSRLLRGEENTLLGKLDDFALGFDYVAPGTFEDQTEGYFRYQVSWKWPYDEFRFYVDGTICRRAEYWFSDWFDSASLVCTDNKTVSLLWAWLCGTGAVRAAHPRVVH